MDEVSQLSKKIQQFKPTLETPKLYSVDTTIQSNGRDTKTLR